ncbi:MAG: AAA family ATPase [Myxococcota bacterium]
MKSSLLSLVFTDLVDSTALRARLGDHKADVLIARHHERVRSTIRHLGGREVDTAGDGFFLTFEVPSTAVSFALRLQQIHHDEPELPAVRVGVHLGEVTEEPTPAGSTKPTLVHGLAVDQAARIQSLAQPGQILMSGPVFDTARQRLKGQDVGREIRWRTYGPYLLKGIAEPLEVGEAGFDGISPLEAPPDSEKATRAPGGGVQAPSGVSLMSTDAGGSTQLLDELGQERAEPILAAYHDLIRRIAESHRGREVSWLHDGGLYAFSSAAAAVHCAISVQLQCRTAIQGHRLWTRIGLDAGETDPQGDDFFGMIGVNASKLCELADAKRGQILCTQTVRGLLAGQRTFTFQGPRLERLEGIEQPVAAFEVEYATDERRVVPARMPFAGRQGALAELGAALQQSIDGEGGIVWVSGEAGIGKTRLVEEFCTMARTRASALYGACREGDGARPYAPFAEALAALARTHEPHSTRQILGTRAGLIARFVPELGELLPGISEPPELPPQEELFRVLDAVSRTLVAVARDRPHVIVLDDLHWADRRTVDMLLDLGRFVGSHRLLIVGVYRSETSALPSHHPLRRCFAELPKDIANYREIPLGGLARSDVAQLLRSIDTDITAELAESVRDYTGGNPFFVRETLSHLYEEGRPIDREATLGSTGRAFEVVRRRVTGLSDAAQDLLRVACAFEGTLDFDSVRSAAGLESKQAADAIDESISARVLWPGRKPEQYEFIHALVRDVLYADLGPQNQIAQHRRIARALEALPGHRPERASEIASQYYRAGSPEDTRHAIEYTLAAADRAEAAHDYAQVSKFCQWAQRIMAEDDERLPSLLRRLAFAQAWSLDARASRTAIEAGRRTAAREGSGAAADFLARAHAALRDSGAMTGDVLSIISEGLRLNGDRRGPAWMSFTLTLVRFDPESFTYRERSRDFEEAERIGEALAPQEQEHYGFRGSVPRNREQALSSGNPDLLVWYCGEYEAGLQALRRRAQDREREGRIRRALDSWAFVSRCCSALGELDQASDAIERATRLMGRLPRSGTTELQVDGARDDLRRARGYPMRASELARLESIVGGPLEASTATDQQKQPAEDRAGRPWAYAPLRATLAAGYAELGRRQDALRQLDSLRDVIANAFVGWDMYQSVAWLAAETLWVLDVNEGSELIELIETGIDEKIRRPGFGQSMTDARLALARLAALQRRHDAAQQLLAEARITLQEQKARPLLAIADYDEALMHERRGNTDGARAKLRQATQQFQALSMPGWSERADALLRAIP